MGGGRGGVSLRGGAKEVGLRGFPGGGLGWVAGGVGWASPFWAEEEVKGSSDDFRDLFGPTCGDPPPSLPPADPLEAVNRSSLPFLRARAAPFCFEGSDFAPPDPPERRSPPLRHPYIPSTTVLGDIVAWCVYDLS